MQADLSRTDGIVSKLFYTLQINILL